MHEPIVSLAVILVLGVGAQWLAWRLRVPSILLLLLLGMLVGPISTAFMPGGEPLLDPDGLLGELLLPLVSLSVGLILYEGGLTLSLREISGVRKVIYRLVTVGALVTWVIALLAARLILGLDWRLAALLAAILVVTGPTVIGPLMNHVRPIGKVGPVLRWEGIVIDPIGALLAVLIYEAIVAGQFEGAAGATIRAVLLTAVVGGGLGVIAALVLAFLLRRYWIPDWLQNPVSLLLVVLIFVLADQVQEESGLLAATVMGIVLANQRGADVRHIIEFKESLRVLLLAGLFITLGARLTPDDLRQMGWESVAFVATLILVARPACVWVATLGSGLTVRERIFLSCVGPRGIVAASVASVFAISLQQAEAGGPASEQAGLLVSYTFAVILGTVAVYGLSAAPIARRLGLASHNPQGVLFVGAPAWAREVGAVLQRRGFRVLMLDTNPENVRAARLAGLTAVYGNALHGDTLETMDLAGIGRVLAVTPNDEVNALVAQRFVRLFDRANVYRLVSTQESRPEAEASELPGRKLFARDATSGAIASRMARGSVVKVTTLTEEFTFEDFKTLYGPRAMILFVISEAAKLAVVTDERPAEPQPGQSVVALVNPDELLMR